MREVLAVFVATTIGTGIFSIPLCLYLVSHYHVLSILLHGSSLQVLLVWGRMLLHYVALHYSNGDDGESGQVNTLIIGAGDAGATIAREIERYHKRSRRIIGFVDDDMFKHNRLMNGFRIFRES